MQKTTRFCIESDNTIILLSAVVILHILSNAVSFYVINKQYSQAQLLARGSAEKRTMIDKKNAQFKNTDLWNPTRQVKCKGQNILNVEIVSHAGCTVYLCYITHF